MPEVLAAPPPILVTLDEAARLLCCSRSMVKVMIRRAEIPSLKIGRLTRIPRLQLEEVIVGRLGPPRVVPIPGPAAWVHRAGTKRRGSTPRSPHA